MCQPQNIKGDNMLAANFKYRGLIEYFEKISAIPRPSFHEEKIADYICDFAKDRGLFFIRDSYNNVFVRLPASKGREGEEAILLQGHTDMVCEKNADVEHDFFTQGIELFESDGYIRAKGTTLGADNGVAVAVMLYILDGAEGNIKSHPTIECLFTATEEKGLVGAAGFDYSAVTATKMLNMDSADDSEIIVGCAGGERSELEFSLNIEKTFLPSAKICVKGLYGGHSGEDINRGRANANKIMGRVLNSVLQKYEFSLISVCGGSKDNAIPRECEAFIVSENLDLIEKEIAVLYSEIAGEMSSDDAGFSLSIEKIDNAEAEALSEEDTKKVIFVMSTVPDGVLKMSTELESMVEFSRNLGIVDVDAKKSKAEFVFMARSAKRSQVKASSEQIAAYADMFGGCVNIASSYPGWDGNADSPLCKTYAKVYKELFGIECRVSVIHAGLECAIIKERCPKLDIISCGAIVLDLHSPDECLEIASFERFFTVIKTIIEQ